MRATVGVTAFGHSRLDDAVDAFARASTSAKREIAAIALYNKGFTLGVLGRSEEAIVVYDELIRRDGGRHMMRDSQGVLRHVAQG